MKTNPAPPLPLRAVPIKLPAGGAVSITDHVRRVVVWLRYFMSPQGGVALAFSPEGPAVSAADFMSCAQINLPLGVGKVELKQPEKLRGGAPVFFCFHLPDSVFVEVWRGGRKKIPIWG